MKNAVLFVLLIISQHLSAEEIDGKVKASIHFATEKQLISVELIYKVMNLPDTATSMRFFLTSKAVIKSITGHRVSGYYIDTTTRPASSVVVLFDKTGMQSKPRINFQYSLTYDTAKYRRFGFIELGLDWFWFPVHPKVNEWNLTYDLQVTTDEKTLELFSNGEVLRGKKKSFHVKSIYPDYDIDLFLLKNSKIYKAGNNIRIVGDTSRPLLKDSLAKETLSYLEFYSRTFGKTASHVTAIFRPQLNDPNAFGYSRKGYFVLSEPKTFTEIKQYVAHEIAHFWFIHGERTENAWLTESFAEFSAMLAMKHFYGDSAYQLMVKDKLARLERFKREGKIVPSIHKNGTKNKSMLSQVALYHKGPLVLDQLMQQIGEPKLIEIMKRAFEKKTRTTADFLSLIDSMVSPGQKTKTKDLIMNY